MANRIKITLIIFLSLLALQFFFVSCCWALGRELEEAERMQKEAQPKAPRPVLRAPVEYRPEGLRDPFQGYKEKKEDIDRGGQGNLPLPVLKIQGVVWGGTFPQAIINNKVVKIGDVIEEARIIDISKDNVTVFFGGRQYNLYSPATQELQKDQKTGGQNEK